MKWSTSMLLASASWASATNLCTGTARDEGGNWFCGAVKKIKYDGVGASGSFQAVTGMTVDGQCSRADVPYGGPFAPLDEDLSIHVRGPIHLKQFAVYNLNGVGKREEAEATHIHARRHTHGHGHAHLHQREQSSESSLVARAGTWKRGAYYNAVTKTSKNLVFLGNYGGQGSGVWDGTWGNSLSYINDEATAGSDSPQLLKDVFIGSNKEFSIWSDKKCNGDCGFARADDVAYKGFGGANKIFLFHFKMPLDGDRGFNGDMPAIWALNTRISRTQQYGDCSCWQTGCGEMDIFEVLASGDTKAKTTFHMKGGLGSSDYFERPVDKLIKVAAIMDQATSTVTFTLIPSNFKFGSVIDDATVRKWIGGK